MNKDKTLKYQKIIQEQYQRGIITKKQLNNELEFIRQTKQRQNDKLIKTERPKTIIQMDQMWCRTTTSTTTYQFRENRTRSSS